jgi:uncharacterized membrane protein
MRPLRSKIPWYVTCFSMLPNAIRQGVRMENSAFSLVSRNDQTRFRYTDVERWMTLATAGALLAYGFIRRTVPGMCLAFAAAPLAYRGVVGAWPRFSNSAPGDDTRIALSGNRGTHIRESVRLEKPVAEVYRFWRNLQNLPRFMTHLTQVTDLGTGRSHWEAQGPARVRVEWDAEIINEVEDKLIAWRSLPGSDVVTAGSVNFSTVRDGRSTEIDVHLQYEPPAGRAGHLFATVLGRNPSSMIREDLRHLKQLLEAGEIPRATIP